MATINLPFAASATKRAPNTDELANGFPCGDADKQLFDWLAWWESGQIAQAIAAGGFTVDDIDLGRLAKAIQKGMNYAVAGGTGNALTLAMPLPFPSLAALTGVPIRFRVANANTSAVTLNVDGLGAKTVAYEDGTVLGLQAGDLSPGMVVEVVYQGSFFTVTGGVAPYKPYYAVCTGTANAWVAATFPPLGAYSTGRVLWLQAPATNTQGFVTANVSSLGTRQIKIRDGSTNPAIGDLVGGVWYPFIDNGTYLVAVAPLASEWAGTAQRLTLPYLGFHGDPVSQSIPNSTVTLISSYTGVVNNLPGATQSGGVVTIGTTGFYQVTANMLSLLADYSGNAYGASISVSKVNGSNVPISSIAATPIEILASNQASSRATAAPALAKLTAGDRIGAFFAQNRGSAQSVSISLDIEFRGA